MDTEKKLEILKAEQARLLRWFLVPGVILFVFILLSSSPFVVQLIAPLSVGAVIIILCVLDMAIAIPLVIKLDKIKKQILKLTEDNPE